MLPNFKMEMGRGARFADVGKLLPALHAVARLNQKAGRVEVSIKGKETMTVGKGVADDDDPFVSVPPLWLGVGDKAVADGVDGGAKGGTAVYAAKAPIFPSVELAIAVAEHTKILPTAHTVAFGWLQGKIKGVYCATRCIAAGNWLVEQRGAGVAGEGERNGRCGGGWRRDGGGRGSRCCRWRGGEGGGGGG